MTTIRLTPGYRWWRTERRVRDGFAHAMAEIDTAIWKMEEVFAGTAWRVRIIDQEGLTSWVGPMEVTHAVMSADSIARYGQRTALEPA